MKKIDLKNFNNEEYLNFIKNKFPKDIANEIIKLDNYIDFLTNTKNNAEDFNNKSNELFKKLKENCWLLSAEDFFNYLLEQIQNGIISIEDVYYLINASYLNVGFKIFLENFIANKRPPRFPHNMRKFSELDPLINELIDTYNLNK